MEPSQPEITDLLAAWSMGDQAALEKLIPLVYNELRRLARYHVGREGADHTLQATALVHEAWLRLMNQRSVQWQNRGHFFAIAAQAMRRILVSAARRRLALRRGGKSPQLSLEEVPAVSNERPAELVAIDQALETLATVDERKAQVVELRFFGGLSVEETAEVLKVLPETVMREWKRAKAWLYKEVVRGGTVP